MLELYSPEVKDGLIHFGGISEMFLREGRFVLLQRVLESQQHGRDGGRDGVNLSEARACVPVFHSMLKV